MPGLESPESNGPAKDVPPAPAEGGLPEKRIISQAHLEAFLSSPTHQDILAFIEALNDRCAGVKTTDSCERSPVISAILSILSSIAGYVELCPPVDNALSRFGNPSFRSFYDKVVLESPQLHASIPGLPAERIPELSVYLTESFGNRDRIDYGSGMELNFICWLLCLQKLGLLQPSDYKALVITVFCTYLQDMRALQSTYWLEPAGSHGVWGLDDYACGWLFTVCDAL
jgi:serine/threonine-protein phosphatase 2A activator